MNPLTRPVAGQRRLRGGDKCLTHALWRDLSDRLTGFLNNITLGELVNNGKFWMCLVASTRMTRRAPAVVRRTLSTLNYALN